ncbi:MAG TPA: hypothetical protein VFI92_16170 [Steroidobacteraceae bacterium]|nr:hypothetical protein [Steroidobacteraceae bacterium]
MNVSLQGARRQSRLDWDAIELRNKRAQDLPRRVFFGILAAVLAYVAWSYFSA